MRPDPADCSGYQICLHDFWVNQRCPSGLYWNAEFGICDWPANVRCAIPESASTAAPVTEAPAAPSTAAPTVAQTEAPAPSSEAPIPVVTAPPAPPVVTAPPAPSQPGTTVSSGPASSSGKLLFRKGEIISDPSAANWTLLTDKYKVICYYTNWSWYRQGEAKYSPADIDLNLCTHILYGFATLDPNQSTMRVFDSWSDTDEYGPKLYSKVTALKSHGIKVLIALGGWNDSAGGKYSAMVNNPAARRRFIENAIIFIENYGFDGLDLDWEYPKCWQVWNSIRKITKKTRNSFE